MEASPLVTSGTDGDTNSESFPKKLKVNDDSLRGVPNGEVVQGEADSTDNTENAKPYENGDHKEHKTSCCAAATAEDGNGPSTSSGNRGEPLKAVLDATEAQYIDARTTEQMNDIEAEIKQNLAFISEKEDVSILEEEYEDAIYIQKIADLKTRYRWLRRTRGDGNCFYRSLGLSLFENLMNAKDIPKANAFADLMVKCKDELLEMGYPKFTMEDFVDTVSRAYETALNQVVDVCSRVLGSVQRQLDASHGATQ
ncbi:hypothetical protein RvY_14031-2 [Ramazzottius varieornatus]|uniref:Uncharacterized protein n=1 Tax=Ramazzottius varieornatus TaxID=947166 RepID=A0A1D1VPZ2_RAMVA|nr:hypothetical protein RvY_14031-2 [Ramazzottius varieornatus]